MKSGIFVTISSKWSQPTVYTLVDDEGISLSVPVEDFVEALVREIGPVTWVIRDATFQEKVAQALGRVIEGIKRGESPKVMGMVR